jgi:hypothetical protein
MSTNSWTGLVLPYYSYFLKRPGRNLSMEMKELYNDNYKEVNKIFEEDIKRWEDLPYTREA